MAAGRSRIISEGRQNTRPKIVVLCIRNGAGLVGAYRRFNRSTASTFFHCVMHAPDNGQAHGQIQNTDQKQDKDRPNDGKFNRRRAAFVAAYIRVSDPHLYFNRIRLVLTIGVVNVPATVMPGNNGA